MEVLITDVDIVKWWGAIIATIALGWNIISYKLNAPKIVILTYPICFLDGRVLSTTIENGNTATELASYCLVEIINRGKYPTTISRIEASVTAKNISNMHFSAQSFRTGHLKASKRSSRVCPHRMATVERKLPSQVALLELEAPALAT